MICLTENSSIENEYQKKSQVEDSTSYDIKKKKKRYLKARRQRDIILCLLALIILWPLMLLTMVLIVIDDPHGSPIYSQMRCGKNGKPFRMYKFRSMYKDAEERLEELQEQNEMDGPVFKIKNDPRITRVGKVIRKCSIDELPQLINILRGDMSIVGPRPALLGEVDRYTEKEKTRLTVVPGLTCYWQIQPDRNSFSFEEWIDMDLKYIEDQSMMTDWKIIFRTFFAVLGCHGV